MKCIKCNKDIPENSEFCPYCGNDLRKTEPEKTSEKALSKESDIIKSTITKQNNNTSKTNTFNKSKKLICKKCSKELQPNFKRCPYCGTKIKKEKPKINKDIFESNRLTIILLGIIGVLLIVSTVFITLYFSSSNTTTYTAKTRSDGYTRYIYNTNSKVYHISEKCIAAKKLKEKYILWTNVDFEPGKSIELYNVTYRPCSICAS